MLLVVFCISGYANADYVISFKKGTYNLSGSVSYNKQDNTQYGKSTSFYASPGVLYFISPGIAVGGRINYRRRSDNNSKYESYGIAPAFRYYFSQNDLNPFVELNYGYSTSRNTSGSFAGKDHSETAGVIVGLNYFLAKNVALGPSIAYRRYNYKFDNGTPDSLEDKVLSIGVGVSVFIY